jgi:hypothetical protein
LNGTSWKGIKANEFYIQDTKVIDSSRNLTNIGSVNFGQDTSLSRGAANRLDLASGDSFNLVSGNIQIGGTTVIDSNKNAFGNYCAFNYSSNYNLVSDGTTVQFSNSSSKSTKSTSYTKVKETTINIPLTGTFRVYFNLGSDTTGKNAYGKLYKNGSAIGTEHVTNTASQIYYDTVTNCAAGDKFQIYAHGVDGVASAIVWNVYVCFEKPAPASTVYDANL